MKDRVNKPSEKISFVVIKDGKESELDVSVPQSEFNKLLEKMDKINARYLQPLRPYKGSPND